MIFVQNVTQVWEGKQVSRCERINMYHLSQNLMRLLRIESEWRGGDKNKKYEKGS